MRKAHLLPDTSSRRLTMKTFLSIGSGPGMGLATAARFAREGFRVVLSARDAGKAQALAEQLKAEGHEAEAHRVDAGDPASVAALVAAVESAHGAINVLHYNAASMRKANLAEQPRDTFTSDFAINTGGAMVAVQAATARMREHGSGTILITGGGYALRPNPNYLSLSIGKAASRAFAQAIFESFKANGIHVAMVTVAGDVTTANDAGAVAEHFWQLHSQKPGAWEWEVTYTPKG
jgi:NAD(P)-dependent dehydrogenase (short-subunit alcohol dehydrogenase family)